MTEGSANGAVRKQRMGAPKTDEPSDETSNTVDAPAKTRMGSEPLGSGAQRTRMGAQASAPAARTRMGASSPPPGAASESSSTPDTPPTAPTPRSQVRPPTTTTTTMLSIRDIPWKRIAVWGLVLLIAATIVVFFARWLRSLADVQAFVSDYPGTPTLPDSLPVGVPGWMGWQHFFNMFFMMLIVRTGLQVRHERKAPAYFTPTASSFFSPRASTPKKVSLTQWLHQSLDVFWVVNGIVFIVLLFATGQWLKIVPTDWDVVPNALSAALQYASLEWPSENGWLHYNALQMLAYTTTVFIAAPLAIISGIRISTWWPDTNATLTRLYPVEVARAIHYPVMLYFVAFTLVHVMLVFLTDALRNLNHMYTSRDTADWLGLGVFLGSVLVIVAAWILTRPLLMRPVAQRFGTLSK